MLRDEIPYPESRLYLKDLQTTEMERVSLRKAVLTRPRQVLIPNMWPASRNGHHEPTSPYAKVVADMHDHLRAVSDRPSRVALNETKLSHPPPPPDR